MGSFFSGLARVAGGAGAEIPEYRKQQLAQFYENKKLLLDQMQAELGRHDDYQARGQIGGLMAKVAAANYGTDLTPHLQKFNELRFGHPVTTQVQQAAAQQMGQPTQAPPGPYLGKPAGTTPTIPPVVNGTPDIASTFLNLSQGAQGQAPASGSAASPGTS